MAGVEDTIILNLRFKNGIIGSLLYSGAIQTREDSSIQGRVCGTKGTIELYNGRAVLTEGPDQKAQVIEDYKVADYDGGYFGEFLNFYEAIREGAKVVSTAEEALKDFTLIMRALDSAESGNTIRF
jgi:predicted dehydrogenase